MKLIDCPEHPGEHKAKLFTRGEQYEGIWECPTGISDTCEHEDTREEATEIDTTRNGEHDTYDAVIEICEACDCTIEARG